MAAHRYWRLLFPTAINIGLTEVEMHLTIGGLDVTGSGTASASSFFGSGLEADKAFDNNASTFWNVQSSPVANEWLKYDFGSGNDQDIQEVTFYYVDNSRCPSDVIVQFSDDNSTWFDFSPTIPIPAPKANFVHKINSVNGGMMFRMIAQDLDGGTYATVVDVDFGGISVGPGWGNSSFGFVPSNATDGNTATRWVSDAVANPILYWLGQDGIGVDYSQINITGNFGGGADHTPKAFDLYSSGDNGSTWDLLLNVSQGRWSDLEVRNYAVSVSGGLPGIPPDARVTQYQAIALEAADGATEESRVTQYQAIVLERLIPTLVGELTQMEVISLEFVLPNIMLAEATQMQILMLETNLDQDTIFNNQDRAFRRFVDDVNFGTTRFIDEYVSLEIGGDDMTAAPRWSDRLTASDSGSELITALWSHPLFRFTMPEAIRTQGDYEAVRDHWLLMNGSAHTWPWSNPLDYASCALTDDFRADALSDLDQRLGFGDGVTTQFQIVKRYEAGFQSYDFPIVLPVIGSVRIAFDGVPYGHENWTVSRYGGIVTFNSPPSPGVEITAGFLFDHEVRFEGDDAFEGIMQSFAASGFSSLTLIGVRPDDS